MKITKKGIAMTTVLLICFILRGDILQFPCYTYHFERYIHSPAQIIQALVGYIAVFLVFACGFFGIYDYKRLGLIFLAVQPAKLIMDISEEFISERFEVNVFYPVLGLFLLFIIIYLADLFIGNRNGFKENIKQNVKLILLALAVSIALSVVVFVATIVINETAMKKMLDTFYDEQVISQAICHSIILLVVYICMFAAGILCLRAIISKAYNPTVKCTKTAEISLTAAAIVLLTGYIVYYLMNYVNPIFYYIEILEETKGLHS